MKIYMVSLLHRATIKKSQTVLKTEPCFRVVTKTTKKAQDWSPVMTSGQDMERVYSQKKR